MALTQIKTTGIADNAVTDAKVVDAITSSNHLPLAGGTMTGVLNMNSQNITNAGTIQGTLSTASQTNITSVGTLTGLTVGGTITSSADMGGGRDTGMNLRSTNSSGYGFAVNFQANDGTDDDRIVARLYSEPNNATTSDFRIATRSGGTLANRLTITGNDTTFSGMLGIGGTAIDKLDIHGGNARIRVGGLGLIQLKNDGSNHSLIIANNNGGSETIRFHTSGSSYLTGGNFGLGHGSPPCKFTVKSSSAGAIASGIGFYNSGDTNLAAAIFEESTSPTSGELRLYSGGAEKVYLRANSSSSNAFLFKGGQMQDITANNTGIQYRANWDTGFINRIDNNFDGASAYSSYMRFKIASGAGSQTTALTLHGDGNVTAGSIMQSPNFRTGRNTTSVPNTTWTQLTGLTNLAVGLYTIHAYIADYQATQWSVHGVVEHTGHNTMHGVFQNHSTMELRTNNKDIELWHSAGGTFTIQVSWTKQA